MIPMSFIRCSFYIHIRPNIISDNMSRFYVPLYLVLHLNHSPNLVPMYVATVPNRSARPTYLIRQGKRDGRKVVKTTLANISKLPDDIIDYIRILLRVAVDDPQYAFQHSFRFTKGIPHGNVAAVLGCLRDLKLHSIIATKDSKQRRLAIALIAARILEPKSKLATSAALHPDSASHSLGAELGLENIDEDDLYQTMDWLLKRKSTIEERLARQHLEEGSLVLCDVTNTYFEGSASGIDKARHGHSKDDDCPLLTLALVVDTSGFVRRSKVFKGNVREDCTLAEMLEALKAPRGARVVMDRGIATEERIQWLREHGYRYVVVSRQRKRVFDSEAAQTIKTAATGNLELYREASEDEVRLYCKSKPRAEIERAMTAKRAKSFEEALQELSDGLLRPKTYKRLDRVWERIGRMKERFGGIGQHYEIKVQPDDNKGRLGNVEAQPQARPHHDAPGGVLSAQQ